MSDHALPNLDAEAERLEAALERIAALARRPPPELPPESNESDVAHEQATVELDGLIARLRERLGRFDDVQHASAEDGSAALPIGAGAKAAGTAGEGI